MGGVPVNLDIHDPRAANHDLFQIRRIVIFEGTVDAETVAQRSGQQAASCRRADEGKGIERDADRTGAGALVDHDIDDEILHRGIKVFLHFGGQAVYLVNKEDIPFLERSQQAGQVARLVEDGTGGHLHPHSHLVGDDMRQRRLAQAGRTVEQGVVQGFAAHLGGLYIYGKVRDYLLLSREIIQLLRSDNSVQFIIFADGSVVGVELAHWLLTLLIQIQI